MAVFCILCVLSFVFGLFFSFSVFVFVCVFLLLFLKGAFSRLARSFFMCQFPPFTIVSFPYNPGIEKNRIGCTRALKRRSARLSYLVLSLVFSSLVMACALSRPDQTNFSRLSGGGGAPPRRAGTRPTARRGGCC